MFVLSNLFLALGHVLQILIWIAILLLFVRMVISWLPPQQIYRYQRLIYLVTRTTDWALRPLRRRLPLVHGGMDFSPLVVLLILYFLEQFLVRSLFQAAVHFAR